MSQADTITDKKLEALLAPSNPNEPITSEHRAWMNSQIENALAHKRSGQATYKSADEIRHKYGL